MVIYYYDNAVHYHDYHTSMHKIHQNTIKYSSLCCSLYAIQYLVDTQLAVIYAKAISLQLINIYFTTTNSHPDTEKHYHSNDNLYHCNYHMFSIIT